MAKNTHGKNRSIWIVRPPVGLRTYPPILSWLLATLLGCAVGLAAPDFLTSWSDQAPKSFVFRDLDHDNLLDTIIRNYRMICVRLCLVRSILVKRGTHVKLYHDWPWSIIVVLHQLSGVKYFNAAQRAYLRKRIHSRMFYKQHIQHHAIKNFLSHSIAHWIIQLIIQLLTQSHKHQITQFCFYVSKYPHRLLPRSVQPISIEQDDWQKG